MEACAASIFRTDSEDGYCTFLWNVGSCLQNNVTSHPRDRLCQSSWLQIQRSWVRFPALPDFLRSSGSGTGPLSLVRITEALLERKSSGSGSRKPRLMAVAIRCADHATLSIRKSWRRSRCRCTISGTADFGRWIFDAQWSDACRRA
jgi:hypothetical protein